MTDDLIKRAMSAAENAVFNPTLGVSVAITGDAGRFYRAITSSILKVVPAVDWKPIATMPDDRRDGRPILFWRREFGPIVACYSADRDSYGKPYGWCDVQEEMPIDDPTHWADINEPEEQSGQAPPLPRYYVEGRFVFDREGGMVAAGDTGGPDDDNEAVAERIARLLNEDGHRNHPTSGAE